MTSYDIAKELNLTHNQVMNCWRKYDNVLVHNRFIIECSLCITDEDRYLYNCANSLLLICALEYGVVAKLNDINLSGAKSFIEGGVV